MSNLLSRKSISRRDFLKLAGGVTLTAAGATLLPQYLRKALKPEQVVQAQSAAPDLFFAGTDGWMYLPGSLAPYHPDTYAPKSFYNLYFRLSQPDRPGSGC